MKMRMGYRGYCTHSSFGEYRMPVPAQNIIYRDYTNKKGLHLKISVNELYFPDCFLQLHSLLNELDELEGVLMCSMFMLPQDFDLRSQIYESFADTGCELHFVLESLVLRTRGNFESLENIFSLRQQLPNCLETLDLKRLMKKI